MNIIIIMSIKYHTIQEYTVQEYENANIFIIENILTTDFCDNIRNLINIIPTEKKTFEVGNNVKCYTASINDLMQKNDDLQYKFSKENDNSKILEMVKQKDIYTNIMNGITVSEIKDLSKKMDAIMMKLGKILSIFNINMDANTEYIIRKIYGETRLHCDGLKDSISRTNLHYFKDNKARDASLIRCASIIFSLNDDYDGVEFIFPKYNVNIKLKRGSVLIFPPYWTHQHGTKYLLNNTYRYTITTWGCESVYTFGI